MAVKRAMRGDNVIYRRSNGESMAVIITAAQGAAPVPPVAVGSGTGGTLPAATYTYRTTFVRDGIESVASGNSNSYVSSGSTSSVTVTAATQTGNVTSYRLYGRTGGTFLFIIADPTPVLVDTGANTPTGASPTDDSNASFRTPYAGHAQTTGVLPGITAGTYQKI